MTPVEDFLAKHIASIHDFQRQNAEKSQKRMDYWNSFIKPGGYAPDTDPFNPPADPADENVPVDDYNWMTMLLTAARKSPEFRENVYQQAKLIVEPPAPSPEPPQEGQSS